MRKFWGICLAAILAAGSAQAANWKVSVYGGYGTAAGGALNDMVSGMETTGVDVTEISSAIPIGIEIMRMAGENLSLGIRTGYLMANEASVESSIGIPVKFTWNATAIPVLVGARYSSPAGDNFGINAGLFAGLASIGLSSGMSIMGISLGEASDSTLGVAGAILVGGTMKVGEKTELGLDVGYQLNSVDMEYMDYSTGLPAEDALDLGGIFATLSIGMLF